MSGKCSRKLRTRKSISLDWKIEILNRLEKLEKPSSIAKSYGINESTIRTIKSNEKSIRSSVSSASLASSKCSSYTRNPAIETMEKALIIWIEENTHKDIPINSSIIRQKAVNIYNNFRKQSSSSSQQQPNFSASKGWFEKFKKRHSLCNLKFEGGTRSVDKVANEGFIPQIPKIVEENDYVPDEVFNVNHELANDESIHMISEIHPTNESNSDLNELCTNTVSFTAQNIYKALRLATKLENAILDMDPNAERALKFRRDLKKCCSEYQEIYRSLTKNNLKIQSSASRFIDSESKIEVLNISSEEDSNFEPI